MKVLILANDADGLYCFRRELLQALIAQKHEVYISVPDDPGVELMRQMGCHFCPTDMDRRGTNPAQDLKLILHYLKILKQIKPDMVFTYTIKPNVYGGLACALSGVSYAPNITGLGTAVENGGILQKITLMLYRFGLRKAQRVFFQNQANQKFMLDRKIVRGAYTLLPGSGVNLERFSLLPYPNEDTNIRFLFIGRVMRDKGVGELLSAASTIKAKYADVCFDIVGGYDEDFTREIEGAVAENIVIYHGSQSDVRPFIEKAQCIVLPSYHEGMANVLLEGAASGRPVIATRVPGCIETFDENISGLGCDVKSAQSLADAMETFINMPYEQRKSMGLSGRSKVEREFDRAIVVNAYLAELERT